MKRTIILMASAAAIVVAGAQNLSTEITVDRIVVPELRGVERLSVTPVIFAPAGFTADVAAAEYTGRGSVSNLLRMLSPAPWRMSTERTPYRGYAGAGIFPGLNAAANAGYRFVDTERSAVGAWLNYNGADYKHDDIKVKSHIGTLGAYAAFDFDGAGSLSLDATGMLANVTDCRGGSVTHSAIEAHAAWQGAVQSFSYDAAIGGSYFHNKPMQQAVLDFKVGGGVCHSGESVRWAGMDIDGAILKTEGTGMTLGQYHFTPYVNFAASDLRVRLGAKLSVASGKDNAATRVAPSATVAYAPEHSLVGAQVSFTGGEHLNPVLGIFEDNPFVSIYDYYGRTNIPVRISGALHIGRFGGFGAEMHADYASARNLLLPDGYRTGGYSGWRADTWRVGADVSYAFRTLLVVGAGGDVAGSNNSEGRVSWYEWSDRAKAEARAYAHVTPIDQLDVNLDYVWRHARRAENGSLGAVRSLDLAAAYRITPALTANLSLNNLLCHRYLLVSGLPSQGMHGLAGISYKF